MHNKNEKRATSTRALLYGALVCGVLAVPLYVLGAIPEFRAGFLEGSDGVPPEIFARPLLYLAFCLGFVAWAKAAQHKFVTAIALTLALFPGCALLGAFKGCINYIESTESGEPRKRAPQAGTIQVERTWVESYPNYRCAYAVVSYRNTTSRTFRTLVTIEAVARDAQGRVINTNQRSFFAHERGPIVPGFQGVVKIPIELGPDDPSRIECKITAAY